MGAVFGLRFYRNYPRAGRAYLLFAAASFVAGFSWWGATFVEGDPFAEVVFIALQALLAPLSLVVDRWVVGRFRLDGVAPFWTSLTFPLVSTTSVFISAGLSPAGTFGADAYSQYGWTPVMQLAAVTGLWGFTFLMAWFASVVNYAWETGFAWRTCGRGVSVYGQLLAVVLAFGAGRLWFSPDAEAEVRVVGVTAEVDVGELIDDRDQPTFEAGVAALHDEYLSRTAAAAARGAEIVVWPEIAGLGRSNQVADLIDSGSILAREYGIYLVMPTLVLPESDQQPGDNEVRVFTPTGETGLTHVKYGGSVDKLYGEAGARQTAGSGDAIRGVVRHHLLGCRLPRCGQPDRSRRCRSAVCLVQRLGRDREHPRPDGGIPSRRERRAARSPGRHRRLTGRRRLRPGAE